MSLEKQVNTNYFRRMDKLRHFVTFRFLKFKKRTIKFCWGNLHTENKAEVLIGVIKK